MEISRQNKGSHIVVSINGPIIIGESARQFTQFMDQILAEEIQGVVIDLDNINYVDSTGLGELVGYLQVFNDQGRSLALLNPQDRIMSLLKLTSLDKEFKIYYDLKDALAATP